MSRACSATSFFNRPFSRSSSRRRFISSPFIPAYWARQRFQVDGDLEVAQHLGHFLAFVQQPFALVDLTQGLFGGVDGALSSWSSFHFGVCNATTGGPNFKGITSRLQVGLLAKPY